MAISKFWFLDLIWKFWFGEKRHEGGGSRYFFSHFQLLRNYNLHKLQLFSRVLWRISQPLIYSNLNFGLLRKNGYLKILICYIWGKRRGGGGKNLQLLLMTLKKVRRIFNFQSNEPSPKLIRPPLTYNLTCPPGTLYNICPRILRGGGLFYPWSFFNIVFGLFWTKGYIKKFGRTHLENRRLGGKGASRHRITFDS